MAEKKVCKSARVDAVKAYATEHYEVAGWDIVVETYSDWDIYAIVKHQLSHEGAIRKVAQHVGAVHERRKEIQAMAGGEDKPDTSVMYCEKCNAAMHSYSEMVEHVCPEAETEVIDPAAPNGYFKNGKPKPVSKARMAELVALGLITAVAA